jgi:superfamily II DNA/RNA helicase
LNPKSKVQLQSRFPFTPLKKTIIPTTHVSFASLGIRPELIAALENMSIHQPTVIQKLVVPQVLKGISVLCAAETGSGKTLAYLLPTIQLLKQQEEEATPKWIRSQRRPRAIILLPSRELVDQTLTVAKYLSHYVKYRAISLMTPYVVQDVSEPFDVVISTPSKLLSFIREGRSHDGDKRRHDQ